MQTIPINDNPNFRVLEAHADAALRAKGFALKARKGSTSWTNQRIKPTDAAVCFKLANFSTGIFFGAREEWANTLGIPLETIGATTEPVRPSPVLFRGDYVQNNPAGRSRIDTIIALFP